MHEILQKENLLTDLDKNTLLSVTSPILANHGNYFQKMGRDSGDFLENFSRLFSDFLRVMRQEIFRNFFSVEFHVYLLKKNVFSKNSGNSPVS